MALFFFLFIGDIAIVTNCRHVDSWPSSFLVFLSARTFLALIHTHSTQLPTEDTCSFSLFIAVQLTRELTRKWRSYMPALVQAFTSETRSKPHPFKGTFKGKDNKKKVGFLQSKIEPHHLYYVSLIHLILTFNGTIPFPFPSLSVLFGSLPFTHSRFFVLHHFPFRSSLFEVEREEKLQNAIFFKNKWFRVVFPICVFSWTKWRCFLLFM